MDRLIIKHYIDELPVEILEAAYNIDIDINNKRFRAQLDFDQEMFEKYKDKIYRPTSNDDYCADFIDFKIGSWYVVMEAHEDE